MVDNFPIQGKKSGLESVLWIMKNKTVEEMREYYRRFDICMPVFNPQFIAVDLVDGSSGRIESWKYNDDIGAFECVKVEYIEKPE